MKVTVITPIYKESQYLESYFAAMNSMKLDKGEVEIIVVDDGSDDGTFEKLQGYSDHSKYELRVFGHKKNLGPGHARNTAIRNARGSILAFTDIDCCPREDWLTNIVETFDHDVELGLISGDITSNDLVFYPVLNAPAGHVKVTANLAINTDAISIDQIYFDKRFYGLIGQDTELANRLINNGHRYKHLPSIIVTHPAKRTTFRKFIRRQFDRKNEVLLHKLFPIEAKRTYSLISKPRLLGRISTITISLILFIVMSLTFIHNLGVANFVGFSTIALALGYLWFHAYLYKKMINARGKAAEPSFRLKSEAFLYLLLAIPLTFIARGLGSYKFKHLLL